MSKPRRNFSAEDRLSIVQEGIREGTTVTCRKYNLAPSLFAKWKRRYEQEGNAGLSPKYYRIDPEKRELELENERLKKIVAKLSLQVEVQGELLKKTPIQIKKK